MGKRKFRSWALLLRQEEGGTDMSPKFRFVEVLALGRVSHAVATIWLWVASRLGRKHPETTAPALGALEMSVPLDRGLYARLTNGNSGYMEKSSHLSHVAVRSTEVPGANY